MRNKIREKTYYKKYRILYLKSHNKCEKCSSTENLEVHHKLPLEYGGGCGFGNLEVLCKKCHLIETTKQNKSFKDIFAIAEKMLLKKGYDLGDIYNRIFKPYLSEFKCQSI